MWSLYEPIHVKSWPKRNWVKLKSVQTLLRIACSANRKSYVVIIYANACEKLTKSENVSSWSRFKYCSKVKILPTVKFIQILLKITSIVPNLTFKGHPVQRSWGQLIDYIHVYDFLYVFHVKFGHNMHHSEDKAH